MNKQTDTPHQLRTIEVPTPSRSYEVLVGQGLLDELGQLMLKATGKKQVAVIADTNVAALYGERVLTSLERAGFAADLLNFPAGEPNKRLSTLEKLLEAIAGQGLTRDGAVVALGGGVTGDMAGLAAALYLRGIQVVQVPTSLLAMVDSSVGGKTAVDLAAGKNLVGAFWQPSLVVADVGCLSTLTPELFGDSIGEVVKHAVLADPDLFKELLHHPLRQDDDAGRLTRIVARNVAIKRDVVVADEHEKGLRQTLNLGHTIGHAVEAAANFSLGHGSCVAIGLCCVTRAAAALGWCDAELVREITGCVAAQGLPTDTALPHDLILHYATHDKKRHADGVNLVVPKAIGQVMTRRVSLETFSRVVELGCGTGSAWGDCS